MEFLGSTPRDSESGHKPATCICSKFPVILIYRQARQTLARSWSILMFYDVIYVELLIRQ